MGARTTESQTHRALVSGMPLPVGFKNGTDGNVQVALDAVISARAPQPLVTFDAQGRPVACRTPGNPDGHVILRGGRAAPNHTADHVRATLGALESAGVSRTVMVDCSHGNSGYDHTRQAAVLREALAQRVRGEPGVAGVMLESHLHAGKQLLKPDAPLQYGVSVTDACIGWEETEALLLEAHAAL